jgi:hypothetical protein
MRKVGVDHVTVLIRFSIWNDLSFRKDAFGARNQIVYIGKTGLKLSKSLNSGTRFGSNFSSFLILAYNDLSSKGNDPVCSGQTLTV